MKREFNIKVTIDDEDKHPLGTRTNIKLPNDYHIVVNPKFNEKVNVELINSIAHELGHIVANEAGMPGNSKQATRPVGLQYYDWETTLLAEREAWDVAEKIRFNEDRNKAYQTYLDNDPRNYYKDFERY